MKRKVIDGRKVTTGSSAWNSLSDQLDRVGVTSMVHDKHRGSVCVINYKGGVGKTTVTALLGIYLSQVARKKVLLLDIDPQCSLSLKPLFDSETVKNPRLSFFNLDEPKARAKLKSSQPGKKLERPLDVLAGNKFWRSLFPKQAGSNQTGPNSGTASTAVESGEASPVKGRRTESRWELSFVSSGICQLISYFCFNNS